jgi:hypothetical protein
MIEDREVPATIIPYWKRARSSRSGTTSRNLVGTAFFDANSALPSQIVTLTGPTMMGIVK